MRFKSDLIPKEYYGSIETPFETVYISDWTNSFRFMFKEQTLFLRAEGDLLKVSFIPMGEIDLRKIIKYTIWLLNNEQTGIVVNPKFGNKPNLAFAAAIISTEPPGEGRSFTILPDDTEEKAEDRFRKAWFKQAPVVGYNGLFMTHVE